MSSDKSILDDALVEQPIIKPPLLPLIGQDEIIEVGIMLKEIIASKYLSFVIGAFGNNEASLYTIILSSATSTGCGVGKTFSAAYTAARNDLHKRDNHIPKQNGISA